MPTAVGTLSTRGWAFTAEDKIRELMNHYTESGASQTVIYRGKIKSLAYTKAMNAQNPDNMATAVQTDLLALYGAVFNDADSINVECTVDVTYEQDSDVRFNLNINLRVRVNGVWMDAVNYVETVDGETS
ncbi:hypothetical protein pEaSNUABM11_00038 [Erwinia phage pEa_SNUABM_11]|nr:hypothetical protein pEaSNUABM11_00038 [Erwinia phage pEa_SNUABM_11]